MFPVRGRFLKQRSLLQRGRRFHRRFSPRSAGRVRASSSTHRWECLSECVSRRVEVETIPPPGSVPRWRALPRNGPERPAGSKSGSTDETNRGRLPDSRRNRPVPRGGGSDRFHSQAEDGQARHLHKTAHLVDQGFHRVVTILPLARWCGRRREGPRLLRIRFSAALSTWLRAGRTSRPSR